MLPNRSHALALAFLATACVVGGVAGWCIKGWVVANSNDREPDAVAYLTQQVGLSKAQQDSVRNVLERHRMGMDSIWRATRPRVDSLRQSMQIEIEEQLTPAQQRRFRETLAQRERERHAADSASQESWDSDHDGVLEGIDRCPATPLGAPVDKVGCPAHSNRGG